MLKKTVGRKLLSNDRRGSLIANGISQTQITAGPRSLFSFKGLSERYSSSDSESDHASLSQPGVSTSVTGKSINA